MRLVALDRPLSLAAGRPASAAPGSTPCSSCNSSSGAPHHLLLRRGHHEIQDYATAAVAVGLHAALTAACSSGNGFSSSTAIMHRLRWQGDQDTADVDVRIERPGRDQCRAGGREGVYQAKRHTGAGDQPLSNPHPAGGAGLRSSGQPPDVFYLDPLTMQSYAKGRRNPGRLNLSTLPNSGGFATALAQAFTCKSTFVCEPKDASTSSPSTSTRPTGSRQGLGAPPSNWSQLQADAKLTTGGRAGLTIDQTHSGIDEFSLSERQVLSPTRQAPRHATG